MDWWLIPVVIGGSALLWFLWAEVFHRAETVSALRELDAYVPGIDNRGDRSGDVPQADLPAGERPIERSRIESRLMSGPGSEAGEPSDDSPGAADAERHVAAGDDGIWIELDIRPLFPSSGHRSVVGPTQAENPERTG